MNKSELKECANEFLQSNYNLTLVVPLEINGRLKRTLGRFRYRLGNDREPVKIELSREFVENNPKEVILDILKHELVHYALFMKNIPHSDGTPEFERELKRLGVVSQTSIRKLGVSTIFNVYKCRGCHHEFARVNRLRNNGINYSCNGCGGSLEYLGKRRIN